MERHQHAMVQILSHLGQVWVYASHKLELLTKIMMVFGRERPTFGDETISIASYCFEVFFSCQHRTHVINKAGEYHVEIDFHC